MTSDGMLRLRVFGRWMAAQRDGTGWQLFDVGNEGKRRPAGVVAPPGLDEAGLLLWLADTFHEAASERHPDVVRLPGAGSDAAVPSAAPQASQ